MTKTIILKCECEWNGDYWDSLLSDDTYKGEYRGFAVASDRNYYTSAYSWTCSDDRLSDVLEAFNHFGGWAYEVERFMYAAGVKIAGNRTQFYKALTASNDDSENACSDVDYWDYTDKWRDDDICKRLGFDPADCVLLEEHKRTVTVSSFY